MDDKQNNQEPAETTAIYKDEHGRMIYMTPMMMEAKAILAANKDKIAEALEEVKKKREAQNQDS